MIWFIKLVKNIYYDEFCYYGLFIVFFFMDYGFWMIYRKMDVNNKKIYFVKKIYFDCFNYYV